MWPRWSSQALTPQILTRILLRVRTTVTPAAAEPGARRPHGGLHGRQSTRSGNTGSESEDRVDSGEAKAGLVHGGETRGLIQFMGVRREDRIGSWE